MPIYHGASLVNKVMHGAVDLSSIFFGSSQVFSRSTVPTSPLDPLESTLSNTACVASVQRRLLTSHTGAIIRIARTSNGNQLDIGVDANGNLDTAAISAFCGSANGVVVTVYDQNGSTNFTRGGTFLSAPIYIGATQTIVRDNQNNPTMSMQKAPYNFTLYNVRTFLIVSADGTTGAGDENSLVGNASNYPRITRDGSLTGRQIIIAGGSEASPVTARWYLNGALQATLTGHGFMEAAGTLPNLRTNTHINGFLMSQAFLMGQLGGPNSFDIQHSGTISEVVMDTTEHTQQTLLAISTALNRGYYA